MPTDKVDIFKVVAVTNDSMTPLSEDIEYQAYTYNELKSSGV